MNKYHSAMDQITVTPQMEERILKNLSRKRETKNQIKKQPYMKWVRYAGTWAACAAILCVLLLNLSVFNSNRESRQIQAPQSATDSAGTLQTQVPVSSEGGNTQPGAVQAQAPKSSDNSGGTTQPGGAQAQASGSSDNFGGTVTQSGGLQAQTPGSSDNAGEPGTQAGGSPIVNTNGIDELKKAVHFELLIPEKLPSGYEIDDTSVISGELAQIIYSDGSNKITYRTAKGADDTSGNSTFYEESNVVKIGDTEVTLKGSKSLINLATWIKDDCSYSLSFSTGVKKDVVVSIIESMKKA